MDLLLVTDNRNATPRGSGKNQWVSHLSKFFCFWSCY